MESRAKLQEIKAPKQSNSTTRIPKTSACRKKMGEYNHPSVNRARWHKLWLLLQRDAETHVVTFFYKSVVDLFLSFHVATIKLLIRARHHLSSSSLLPRSTRELDASHHHLRVFIIVWNLFLITHLEKRKTFLRPNKFMCLINKYDLTIFSILQMTSLYLFGTFCNWGCENFHKKAHFVTFDSLKRQLKQMKMWNNLCRQQVFWWLRCNSPLLFDCFLLKYFFIVCKFSNLDGSFQNVSSVPLICICEALWGASKWNVL